MPPFIIFIIVLTTVCKYSKQAANIRRYNEVNSVSTYNKIRIHWRCSGAFNPLSANFTKWSNTLKQFVGNLPTNYLSVIGHFVGLTLKGLIFVLNWEPVYEPVYHSIDSLYFSVLFGILQQIFPVYRYHSIVSFHCFPHQMFPVDWFLYNGNIWGRKQWIKGRYLL